MTSLRRTVLVGLVGLVAAPLLLTACDDDGDEAPEPAASDTSDASDASGPEAVVRAFYEDFADGDFDAACARWTADYTALSVRRWNEGDYGARVTDCPGLLAALTDFYAMVGDPSEQLEVTATSGELTDDTTARIDVTLASDPDATDTYELTLIDGDWLISGDDAR